MQIWRRYWYIFAVLSVSALLFIPIEGRFFPTGTRGSVASQITHQPSGRLIIPSIGVPGGRLIIPSIGVNAPIEPVRRLSDGNMAVPTLEPWDTAGWYQYGPYPGERGSAVIDGHLDRPGGSPAVFWNLRNLHIGDDIMVVNSGGKVLHFRVVNMQYYTPTDAPLQTIFGNSGGTFLNLITCAGQWIPTQHQTTLRLVVHTILV
ncbi:MAG: class F sortase [Ktedonobacteraceae bacterium]